ncbi:uncharacterized protein LOC112081592 [Eutrema salsugineum]|uniref:uncharacterized protein LOC112081592 n=1 Tax=Eutrema salsugineum TaxID=72664 RepID=UPI000CED51C3|nr:uncharacterized protein LOC112081592 [Eutrema salsugineum]
MPASVTAGLQPDKFDGSNFKQWQERMYFFLSSMRLSKYLTEDPPTVPDGNKDVMILATVEAWKHSDFLCKGHIKNRLVDQLFDVYSEVKTSKELWDALEKKYKSYNVGSAKFATAKLLKFEMVDSRPIMPQVHEPELIFQEIRTEGMKLCETFTVNCFIEKLPPSWADFQNYLAYKQKALSLANLISRLQNESLKRDKVGKEDGQIMTHDANVAEYRKKRQRQTIQQGCA